MDKVAEVLKQLAEKLGTTVEHLWGVLMRQAGVSFWADIIWYALVAVGIAVALTVAVKCYRKAYALWSAEEKSYFSDGDEFRFAWCIAGIIVPALLSVIFTCVALSCIEDTITKRYNPEYWALQQVTKMLKE